MQYSQNVVKYGKGKIGFNPETIQKMWSTHVPYSVSKVPLYINL